MFNATPHSSSWKKLPAQILDCTYCRWLVGTRALHPKLNAHSNLLSICCAILRDYHESRFETQKRTRTHSYPPPTVFKWSINCLRKIEYCEGSKVVNMHKWCDNDSIDCTAAAEVSLIRKLGSSIIKDNSKSALYLRVGCCRSLKRVLLWADAANDKINHREQSSHRVKAARLVSAFWVGNDRKLCSQIVHLKQSASCDIHGNREEKFQLKRHTKLQNPQSTTYSDWDTSWSFCIKHMARACELRQTEPAEGRNVKKTDGSFWNLHESRIRLTIQAKGESNVG